MKMKHFHYFFKGMVEAGWCASCNFSRTSCLSHATVLVEQLSKVITVVISVTVVVVLPE